MTHRFTNNCAKNYCNRTLIVKVNVEKSSHMFLGGHTVYILHHGSTNAGDVKPCSINQATNSLTVKIRLTLASVREVYPS